MRLTQRTGDVTVATASNPRATGSLLLLMLDQSKNVRAATWDFSFYFDETVLIGQSFLCYFLLLLCRLKVLSPKTERLGPSRVYVAITTGCGFRETHSSSLSPY